MTVIAYRDGILASDSLVCSGDVYSGMAKKIAKAEGYLFGMAGIIHEMPKFMEAILNGTDYKPEDKEFSAICINPMGNVFHFHGEAGSNGLHVTAPYHAIGSGEHVALGAMYMGGSAEDAVKAAIKICRSCGGRVQKVSLGD